MAASLGFLDSHDHNNCPAKLALEMNAGKTEERSEPALQEPQEQQGALL